MEIKNLYKSYGGHVVYENFNLEIAEGQITCILGESGSGKTTLLNVIAGLTEYRGEVTRASSSYIFQTPRLVPCLTVRGNLRLVCKDEEKIDKILAEAEISQQADAYPVRLSGGQAQRASVCRAFLYDSDILLMDEPFSSLDLKLKIKMMDLFRRMREERRKTVLFVTHDIDEALYLADRIVVIGNGKIIGDYSVSDGDRVFGAVGEPRQKLLNVILN